MIAFEFILLASRFVSIGMISFSAIIFVGSVLTIVFQIANPFVRNTLAVVASKLVGGTGSGGAILIRAVSTIVVKITTPFLRDAFLAVGAHEFRGATFQLIAFESGFVGMISAIIVSVAFPIPK